jgi:hypothetical protein
VLVVPEQIDGIGSGVIVGEVIGTLIGLTVTVQTVLGSPTVTE